MHSILPTDRRLSSTAFYFPPFDSYPEDRPTQMEPPQPFLRSWDDNLNRSLSRSDIDSKHDVRATYDDDQVLNQNAAIPSVSPQLSLDDYFRCSTIPDDDVALKKMREHMSGGGVAEIKTKDEGDTPLSKNISPGIAIQLVMLIVTLAYFGWRSVLVSVIVLAGLRSLWLTAASYMPEVQIKIRLPKRVSMSTVILLGFLFSGYLYFVLFFIKCVIVLAAFRYACTVAVAYKHELLRFVVAGLGSVFASLQFAWAFGVSCKDDTLTVAQIVMDMVAYMSFPLRLLVNDSALQVSVRVWRYTGSKAFWLYFIVVGLAANWVLESMQQAPVISRSGTVTRGIVS